MFSLGRRLLSTNPLSISLLVTTAILLSSLPLLSVRVRAQTGSDTLATLPSPEVAFIVGPQLRSGTSSLPAAGWFDQNEIDRGLTLCSQFPDVAHTPGNVLISGTVSVTNGSTIVTGSGTHFVTETHNYAIISNGGASNRRLIKIIASVQNDTQLTLTLPWEGSTLSGQTISSPTATEVDNYQGYQMYYDFALTQYINYYRTGDSRLLDCARKAADSWYSQPIIDNGKNLISVSGDSLAPRVAAINGLMLRALDGRPEMWPWIKDYVDYQFHLWDEIRVTYPGFYFGVRDGGFMLLYAANLAATHPDPAVRADFQTRALNVAKNYYARLQGTDGSYRWNDDDFPFSGTEQPFHVGILNEAMIQVHRLTGDSTIRAAIVKSADHEYLYSYNPNGWRSMYYFVHGTIGNPPINCDTGCGNASNPFPPSDTSQITEARQLNATAIHVFGYAYYLTGDPKYRSYGDEVFDATYSGADGYRGLAAFRGKEYDESYRSGGRYLAWRVGGVIPTPSPTPTPSPSPIAVATSVSFIGLDSTTEGSWKNVYGGEGYNTINDSMSYPSYAQVSVTGCTSPTWMASTTDVRGLQKSTATDRIAARWDSNSFVIIDLNLTDGATHRVAIYALDWDGNNRTQRFDLLDYASNALLDSRSISSFNAGQYLVWDIRGHVKITVNKTGAKSAVVSGLYFGGVGATPTSTPTPTPTSSLGKGRKPKWSGKDLSNPLASSDVSSVSIGFKRSSMDQPPMMATEQSASEIQEAQADLNSNRDGYKAADRIEVTPQAANISSTEIVGADVWQARLAGNKQAFVQSWMERPDFQARYAGLSNEQYVDALIANMGVPISAAERAGLVQDLVNGVPRAEVLAKLVENPTFTHAEFNSAGFNFWLSKLNQIISNFVSTRRWSERSLGQPRIVTASAPKSFPQHQSRRSSHRRPGRGKVR